MRFDTTVVEIGLRKPSGFIGKLGQKPVGCKFDSPGDLLVTEDHYGGASFKDRISTTGKLASSTCTLTAANAAKSDSNFLPHPAVGAKEM